MRLSHLEHRVGNIETALTHLQSAWSYQQANFGGGPSLWPGFGISPGAGPVPGFGYQQYTQPSGFYSQPAADWSFTSDRSTPALEAFGSSRHQVAMSSGHPVATSSSHPVVTSSYRPALLPVSSSDDRIYLPSTAIDKTGLRDVAEVVAENIEWKNIPKMPTLCQTLARQCFFGRGVMIRCTAGGRSTESDSNQCYFGLPREEMALLKRAMFDLFPDLSPEEFETHWKKCVTAVGSACRRFRNKEEKAARRLQK